MRLVIRIHSGQAKSRMKCAHGAVANADGSRLVVQAGIIFKASGGLPDSLVRAAPCKHSSRSIAVGIGCPRARTSFHADLSTAVASSHLRAPRARSSTSVRASSTRVYTNEWVQVGNGCLYTRLLLNGCRIHIFSTHLQVQPTPTRQQTLFFGTESHSSAARIDPASQPCPAACLLPPAAADVAHSCVQQSDTSLRKMGAVPGSQHRPRQRQVDQMERGCQSAETLSPLW